MLVLSPHWFGDCFFFELSVAAGVLGTSCAAATLLPSRRGGALFELQRQSRFTRFNLELVA